MVIRTLRWIGERLKDLLYDKSNKHLDSGRCIAAASLLTLIGAVVWNMHLNKEINLAELGAGLTAILGALVVYVYNDRKQDAN